MVGEQGLTVVPPQDRKQGFIHHAFRVEFTSQIMIADLYVLYVGHAQGPENPGSRDLNVLCANEFLSPGLKRQREEQALDYISM